VCPLECRSCATELFLVGVGVGLQRVRDRRMPQDLRRDGRRVSGRGEDRGDSVTSVVEPNALKAGGCSDARNGVRERRRIDGLTVPRSATGWSSPTRMPSASSRWACSARCRRSASVTHPGIGMLRPARGVLGGASTSSRLTRRLLMPATKSYDVYRQLRAHPCTDHALVTATPIGGSGQV